MKEDVCDVRIYVNRLLPSVAYLGQLIEPFFRHIIEEDAVYFAYLPLCIRVGSDRALRDTVSPVEYPHSGPDLLLLIFAPGHDKSLFGGIDSEIKGVADIGEDSDDDDLYEYRKYQKAE